MSVVFTHVYTWFFVHVPTSMNTVNIIVLTFISFTVVLSIYKIISILPDVTLFILI